MRTEVVSPVCDSSPFGTNLSKTASAEFQRIFYKRVSDSDDNIAERLPDQGEQSGQPTALIIKALPRMPVRPSQRASPSRFGVL